MTGKKQIKSHILVKRYIVTAVFFFCFKTPSLTKSVHLLSCI